ncbi:hypothetical protein [Roseibium album]|uniref:Uncharacterized protein n=1 Tax=Roseibium album TaxID=311410 RepID=A0A0M6ZKQ1_9HYPH|nr:hypothetical protein [Roseibium album]CTQ62801.1 hypothetical protein LA5094_05593 [Roseibium album]CTQ68733.1 hypothetical protein LA5096_01888 [Roseibium album]CTQ80385.1 hypothetical protein LA5095_05619 [Roseibium album]
MASEIHRDSLSAWNALRQIGGLDIDDRDVDLVRMLKQRLDATAPDLESALTCSTIDQFLAALFESIQPFVYMFRDILTFFEAAAARQGQSQWRVSVSNEFVEFRHFEEFLEHWNTIDADFVVPALDHRHAFILNDVRAEIGGYDYLVDGMDYGKPAATGLQDVDDWLGEYDEGHYEPFPCSLMPQNFPEGLSELAAVMQAAVSILRRQGFTRQEMLERHRARHYKAVNEDALHPWTIAQSETDFWLRSHIGYLANIRQRPDVEVQALATKAKEKLAQFPLRRLPGKIDVKDIERLLSLPVWTHHYETYGVWIATRIIDTLNDHDVVINSNNGELRFAFGEARIADIETANPRLSLFAERRVALANPVGKSRKEGAQPDFSIWTQDARYPECVLVVEVKHYKKRSRRNFRDALIDYSRAHPQAKVILVNYGPVGEEFSDLSDSIRKQYQMIGPLTPESYQTLSDFRKLVRSIVGDPVKRILIDGLAVPDQIIVLDISKSMQSLLSSEVLRDFLAISLDAGSKIALIDQKVRVIMLAHQLNRWLVENDLGNSTSLAEPVSELLTQYEQIILITDEGGMRSLNALDFERLLDPLSELGEAIFLRVKR